LLGVRGVCIIGTGLRTIARFLMEFALRMSLPRAARRSGFEREFASYVKPKLSARDGKHHDAGADGLISKEQGLGEQGLGNRDADCSGNDSSKQYERWDFERAAGV